MQPGDAQKYAASQDWDANCNAKTISIFSLKRKENQGQKKGEKMMDDGFGASLRQPGREKCAAQQQVDG